MAWWYNDEDIRLAIKRSRVRLLAVVPSSGKNSKQAVQTLSSGSLIWYWAVMLPGCEGNRWRHRRGKISPVLTMFTLRDVKSVRTSPVVLPRMELTANKRQVRPSVRHATGAALVNAAGTTGWSYAPNGDV